MLKRGLKIALVQLFVGPDKPRNIAVAVQEIHKAKQKGAQLVALPEYFNAPYGIEDQTAEEVPSGETCRALSQAAAEAGVCVVGGSFAERCGGAYYNTCTVWDDTGKLLTKHRKMHMFDIDMPGRLTFRESDIYTVGDQISTFEYAGVKIGLGICYDIRFQEMAQIMRQQGCSMLIYPAAFNRMTGFHYWELAGRARAMDQQLWVALVSPARDVTAKYVNWGHSILIDPRGQIVDQLDENPGTLFGEVDFNKVEIVRREEELSNHRRNEIYGIVHKNKTEKDENK